MIVRWSSLDFRVEDARAIAVGGTAAEAPVVEEAGISMPTISCIVVASAAPLKKVTIDKEAGRCRQAKALTFFQVLLYRSSFRTGIQAAIKLSLIELQFAGLAFQARNVGLVAGEEKVVIFPILSLFTSATRTLQRLFPQSLCIGSGKSL